MRKLFIYLKAYKVEAILGPLFKLLEAVIDLTVPLVMALIIDRGITMNDRGLIVRMSLVLIVAALVGLTLSLLGQYFSAKASVGFVRQIKDRVYAHIQGLPFSDMDKFGTDTLIARLTGDMNQIQTGINLSLRLLLRSPFIVTGACVLAFTIDRQIGLIVATTILLLSAVIFFIMFWTIPGYKIVQKALDTLLSKTRENLTGVRVIRAFCKEEDEIADFQAKNETLTRLMRRVAGISALMNPLTFAIIGIGTVFLLDAGGLKVDSGSLTKGQIVALYNYMAQILVELVKFAALFINITKSFASGDRVNEVLELQPSMKDGTEVPETQNKQVAVAFRDVGLNYNGAMSLNEEENALNHISFSLNKGETLGIIGGTGSGKTSLVNLILRFYEASTGEVLVFEKNVSDWKLSKLREKIGVVLQKASLFKGSIRENLKMGGKYASDEELFHALEVAVCLDEVKNKEGGLSHQVLQGGRNFSGGQKQRLTIARALAKKPEILILDDSSSALDQATDARLRENIGGLSYKLTTIIVSQRTVSVMEADKILVLDEGKMAGFGTHESLLETSEVYKEIYESQFKRGGERNEK